MTEATPEETMFELVYQIDSKLVARAYKRFLWRRVRRPILIASGISLACLIGLITWKLNFFLVLGTAYPAAYVVMWLSQMGHIDETYESLHGRKIRLLLDAGGISSYSGNTFKRVTWPGVKRIAGIADYYFIYYERDAVPSGGFPKSELSEEALTFLRQHTNVIG